jgi:putative flippase GtrA
MSSAVKFVDVRARWQAARYVVNGVAATLVHFGVLRFNLLVLHIPSAGGANLFAAMAGIVTSFLGSRWFVFRAQEDPIVSQFTKFGLLYACIAMLHAAVLWVWTDRCGFDYRVGFLLATVLQMMLSFVGNKFLVFKQ